MYDFIWTHLNKRTSILEDEVEESSAKFLFLLIEC